MRWRRAACQWCDPERRKIIAIGLRDQVLAAQIDRDGDLGGVPIVLVMLGELEMPAQLSGVGVESEQRVAIKIVAGTAFTAIGGRRIARRPKKLIRSWIINASDPCGRASDLP